MNPCSLIQDLLPLYIDDAVSPESRRQIEEHLAQCAACSLHLEALRQPVLEVANEVQDPVASDDARFLHRLKRNFGTALGAGLVLLVVTGLVANQGGRWAEDRERGGDYHAQQQEATAARERLRALTSDPAGLLRRNGVELQAKASRSGADLTVTYQVAARPDSGLTQVVPARDPGYGTELTLLGTAGTTRGLRQTSGGSQWHETTGAGEMKATGLPDGPAQVRFEYPVLTAWFPAPEPRQWQFRRPGETGAVPINERITIRGIEFEISQVVFDKAAVRIEYRQLTDAATAGVHYLNFRLSDGMGSWGEDTSDTLPHPDHPAQVFSFVNSPSLTWQLNLEHMYLAVPGATETFDIPAAR
jgi:hypothetical protein